ncbi:uncharacterized protein E0L32_012374 [Thyridium curvatum]|uniref:Uncharacterized protein n=1 Tax=Thyridium curvatum TaxID=1093900 RepID=A0A507BB64_9PEZI|nr:uncharacterized protein E0L32_012374 [Thyridium curvatum]TPX16793.1 hypothetical protein E0L32_012374 [Thyridium curvatum]
MLCIITERHASPPLPPTHSTLLHPPSHTHIHTIIRLPLLPSNPPQQPGREPERNRREPPVRPLPAADERPAHEPVGGDHAQRRQRAQAQQPPVSRPPDGRQDGRDGGVAAAVDARHAERYGAGGGRVRVGGPGEREAEVAQGGLGLEEGAGAVEARDGDEG